MTPNDLDAYLQVLVRNKVGAAVLHLPDGTQFQVTLMPDMPKGVAGEPEPGGWKTGAEHLDRVSDLRDDREYRGELP